MSLNRVMLIGNVGKDPEIRYIDSGVPTATFNLATTTRAYRLQNGTEVPQRTEWHRIYLWRKLAEVTERYVHKGDKVYVEGELRTRTYTDRKGVTHTVTEVWANMLELMSPRKDMMTESEKTNETPNDNVFGQDGDKNEPSPF